MRIKPLVVLSLVCSLSQAADTVASLGDSIKATQFVTSVDHTKLVNGTTSVTANQDGTASISVSSSIQKENCLRVTRTDGFTGKTIVISFQNTSDELSEWRSTWPSQLSFTVEYGGVTYDSVTVGETDSEDCRAISSSLSWLDGCSIWPGGLTSLSDWDGAILGVTTPGGLGIIGDGNGEMCSTYTYTSSSSSSKTIATTDDIPSTDGFASTTWVNSKKWDWPTQITNKPSNVSAFNNDAGYVTASHTHSNLVNGTSKLRLSPDGVVSVGTDQSAFGNPVITIHAGSVFSADTAAHGKTFSTDLVLDYTYIDGVNGPLLIQTNGWTFVAPAQGSTFWCGPSDWPAYAFDLNNYDSESPTATLSSTDSDPSCSFSGTITITRPRGKVIPTIDRVLPGEIILQNGYNAFEAKGFSSYVFKGPYPYNTTIIDLNGGDIEFFNGSCGISGPSMGTPKYTWGIGKFQYNGYTYTFPYTDNNGSGTYTIATTDQIPSLSGYVSESSLVSAGYKATANEWVCDPSTFNGKDIQIEWNSSFGQWTMYAGSGRDQQTDLIGLHTGSQSDTNLVWAPRTQWVGTNTLTSVKGGLRPYLANYVNTINGVDAENIEIYASMPSIVCDGYSYSNGVPANARMQIGAITASFKNIEFDVYNSDDPPPATGLPPPPLPTVVPLYIPSNVSSFQNDANYVSMLSITNVVKDILRQAINTGITVDGTNYVLVVEKAQ